MKKLHHLITLSACLFTAWLPAADVCDLEPLYTDIYAYSLPRPLLESFLSGESFDYKRSYTEDEIGRLKADIEDIYQANMALPPAKQRTAYITAGAPGAGKTTVLNQHRTCNTTPTAYACPDDVCLKNQQRTFLADIATSEHSHTTCVNAYTKWRPASNAATHILLAHFIKDGLAFYYGTTCSSPMTYRFFEFLKAQRYHIHVLHVTAPDEVRWNSIVERDKTFVQTTEVDVRKKGILVPQRITDTFLCYADTISFYYHPTVHEDAILAATWTRSHLTIHNEDAYRAIKTIHNETITRCKKPELLWEKTVETSSEYIRRTP